MWVHVAYVQATAFEQILSSAVDEFDTVGLSLRKRNLIFAYSSGDTIWIIFCCWTTYDTSCSLIQEQFNPYEFKCSLSVSFVCLNHAMPLTRSPVLPVGLSKDVRYAMDQLQKPAPLSPEDTPKTTPSLSSKPHGAGREENVKPPIPPARAPKATPAVSKLPELPAVIVDPESGERYRRGRLLGKVRNIA